MMEEWREPLMTPNSKIYGYADDHGIILNSAKSGILEIPYCNKVTIAATTEWIEENHKRKPIKTKTTTNTGKEDYNQYK